MSTRSAKHTRDVRLNPDSVPYGNGLCRLTTIIELLEHDLGEGPALTLSAEGLIGLQRILQDARRDLGGAR